MLRVQDLKFSFGKRAILKNASFHLNPGEIVVLIGISGSGKTTLFRLISGLLHPDSGEIAAAKDTISYMRQEDLLLPWRTVLENLMLVSELGKRSERKKVTREQALFLLNEVGLRGFENTYPRELSGGMQKRAALARALILEKPVLLLDEPFASLDVVVREQLYTLLRRLQRKQSKTILMVTHDFRDALALADRILILAEGEIKGDYQVPVALQDQTSLIQEIRNRLSSEAYELSC